MSVQTPPSETTYLASVDDLALKLGVPATDPRLLLALRRAGDRLEGTINYPVSLVHDDVIYLSGDGSRTLLLPARPVQGLPTVEIDGTPITDFRVGRQAGILRRPQGWPDNLDNIEVTYTHGWPVIPGDIQDAVLEQAETQFHVVVAFQSRSSGTESVTFSALAAVGVTQRWTDVVNKYAIRGGQT